MTARNKPVSEAPLLIPGCTSKPLQHTLPGLFQCFGMTGQYRQH